MSAGDCGCGPSTCPPRSLVHDWKLVQLLNAQQAALGRESKVDFGDLAATVDGRYAHVAALKIAMFVQLTNKAGATADALVTDHALRSLIYGMQLQDRPAWRFFDKLDGRDVYEAEYLRFGRYLARAKMTTTTVGHGVADVVSGAFIELTIDFTRPDGDPERYIPVSALQAMGADAMRFSFRDDFNSVIRGVFGAGSDCHATNLFQSDGSTPGIEVHASIVELDALNHPPRWGLRSYERDNTEGQLDHADASHTMIVLRNRVEDHAVDGTYVDGGETAAKLIDGGQFNVGGREVLSLPLSKAVMWAFRDLRVHQENMSSFASRPTLFAGFGFPNVVPTFEDVLNPGYRMVLPYTDRKVAPAGRVGYRIETLPLQKFRVLHEFVRCGGDDDVGHAAKNAGIKTFTRVKRGQSGEAQIATSAGHANAVDPTGATLIVPDKVS